MDFRTIVAMVEAVSTAHFDLTRPFDDALRSGTIERRDRPRAEHVNAHLRKAIVQVWIAKSHAQFPDYAAVRQFDFEQNVERLRHIGKRQLERGDIRELPPEEMINPIVDIVLADALGCALPPRKVPTIPRRPRRR